MKDGAVTAAPPQLNPPGFSAHGVPFNKALG
jgi:hypothetical protein